VQALSEPAVRSGTRRARAEKATGGGPLGAEGGRRCRWAPVALRLGVNEPTLRNWQRTTWPKSQARPPVGREPLRLRRAGPRQRSEPIEAVPACSLNPSSPEPNEPNDQENAREDRQKCHAKSIATNSRTANSASPGERPTRNDGAALVENIGGARHNAPSDSRDRTGIFATWSPPWAPFSAAEPSAGSAAASSLFTSLNSNSNYAIPRTRGLASLGLGLSVGLAPANPSSSASGPILPARRPTEYGRRHPHREGVRGRWPDRPSLGAPRSAVGWGPARRRYS
jgi:hypothetical protein